MSGGRAQRRRTLTHALRRRNALLSDTLRDVWLWLSTDGEDLDRLRAILLAADERTRLEAALDDIGVE